MTNFQTGRRCHMIIKHKKLWGRDSHHRASCRLQDGRTFYIFLQWSWKLVNCCGKCWGYPTCRICTAISASTKAKWPTVRSIGGGIPAGSSKGKPKAEALRLAQLKMRSSTDNPYLWAGYVLVGDAGIADTYKPANSFTWDGVLIMIGVVVCFLVGLLVLSSRRRRQLNHVSNYN